VIQRRRHGQRKRLWRVHGSTIRQTEKPTSVRLRPSKTQSTELPDLARIAVETVRFAIRHDAPAFAASSAHGRIAEEPMQEAAQHHAPIAPWTGAVTRPFVRSIA
jgi:hypothetical protein